MLDGDRLSSGWRRALVFIYQHRRQRPGVAERTRFLGEQGMVVYTWIGTYFAKLMRYLEYERTNVA